VATAGLWHALVRIARRDSNDVTAPAATPGDDTVRQLVVAWSGQNVL
jgi:hypothetical protein